MPGPIREKAALSVGAKLAGATIAIVMVVAGVLLFALGRYERSNLLTAKEKGALMLARLNSDSLSASVVFDDINGINEAIANLARNDEVVYAALWPLDPEVPSKLGPVRAEFRRTQAAFEPPRVPSRAERTYVSSDWVLVETPVLDPRGRVVGMAQAAFSLAREKATILGIERRFLVLSIAAALLLTSALMLLARRVIVRPLARLVVAAKRLEAGEPAVFNSDANDEVGSLARALRAMSAAVENREQRLSERNRDMSLVLENVEEGFLILDRAAKMGAERSLVLDAWFGTPPSDSSFISYLKGIEGSLGGAFAVAFSQVVDGILPLEVTLFQLPTSFQHAKRSYAMRYRPILEGEELISLLVVISDVTERFERERAELLQREMVAIFRQLVFNHAAFAQFQNEAESLTTAIESASPDDQISVKRLVHTLKGNCAMFGIQSVAGACHDIETRMSATGEGISAAEKQRLSELWAKVAAAREQFGDRARAGNLELDEAEYAAFVKALRARLDHDVLRKMVASWRYESAAQCLNRLSDQIEHLAAKLNRAPLLVERVPAAIRLPPRRWSSFWAVFAHVTRNAIDHGIEPAEERVAAGKSPGGHIRLAIEASDDEVSISISDDGRGIDWPKIAEKARQRGIPAETQADLVEALFSDGLSSRDEVTEISGRGIGMGAVRATVEDLGGRVELSSQAGKGSTFRCVFPRAMLHESPESYAPPAKAYQAASAASS